MTKAIVLLSGGQDSAVALAWSLKRFDKVQAISFDYGQKHSIELSSARKIASLMNTKQTIIPINTFSALANNSLVNKDIEVLNKHDKRNLPNTFVPGRNIIFLTYACAFGYDKNIPNIVGGMSETDYSGYPDCREKSIKAIEKAVSFGMDYPFIIHTPLMTLNKEKIWKLAYDLGVFSLVKEYSHSCYKGVVGGCGECNACILRNKGLLSFLKQNYIH